VKFVVKKIPKLAILFYIIGFLIIAIALVNYFTEMNWFDSVIIQQVFILGAIVVACGSVINTIFQFRKKS